MFPMTHMCLMYLKGKMTLAINQMVLKLLLFVSYYEALNYFTIHHCQILGQLQLIIS